MNGPNESAWPPAHDAPSKQRILLRWVMAVFYIVAGYFHLTAPAPFLQIMPRWVPMPEVVVLWTGVAELLGAAALIQPFSLPLRRVGAAGLALYALCVFPANINHFMLDLASEDGGLGLAYHIPRLAAQPVLVWLALWTGGVTDWPVRRRPSR